MLRSNRVSTYAVCAVYTLLLLPLWACDDTSDTLTAPGAAPNNYFSLANYFGQEADRLQQNNLQIVKTVSRNGESEKKQIQVTDWRDEFALFIDADINKPAWQNSYRVDSTGSSLTYTSIDPKLRTKEVRVEKSDTGTVTHIQVTNHVSNMLYQTDEQLDYYADSLYRINKQQKVRVIGESQYTIVGEWQ